MAYYSNPNYSHRHSMRASPAPPIYGQQTNGYGYQSGGPPPGADPQLWQWFTAVDADRSGAISVNELQSALVNGASGFVSLYRLI